MSTSSSERDSAFRSFDPQERLWDRWSRWADEHPERDAIVYWKAGEAPLRWRWRSLVNEAEGFAARLAATGVRPGEVCALVIRHDPRFYPLYMGVSALGAIPSVLAYPNSRLHPDKFVQGLAGMARRSGLDWILTERPLEQAVRPLVTGEESSVRGLLFPLDGDGEARTPGRTTQVRLATVDAGAPCLLQHSSGTTGLQKAVVLSHRAVLEHVQLYAQALDLRPTDKIASWLPLYHDMGMIAAFQIVAGKNLYPEDIEDAVSRVPGILPGRVVAFGMENVVAGTEQVAVVAEFECTTPADRKQLRTAVQQAGMSIDVTIARVYLVPPRWLIKSSAGKPSRKVNRQRITDGELEHV